MKNRESKPIIYFIFSAYRLILNDWAHTCKFMVSGFMKISYSILKIPLEVLTCVHKAGVTIHNHCLSYFSRLRHEYWDIIIKTSCFDTVLMLISLVVACSVVWLHWAGITKVLSCTVYVLLSFAHYICIWWTSAMQKLILYTMFNSSAKSSWCHAWFPQIS